MNNQEGKIWYGLGIDNTGLQRDAEKSKSIFRGIGTQAASDCAKMEQGYNALGLSIQGLGKKLATLGGAVAIEEMARALYNFSSNFNKAMLEVATISDSVSSDMETAKEKILELTTEVPIAADEATKALYQIVSAGYDGAEGMNVLEVSAKAAIGGVTDTATAADAITTLLNAYKKSASDAEGVSDMLFTTVKLGKTTMGELGKNIAQVAPLAAAYGVEMDQVLAGVATLTKSGTPTAQAMTQIRSALTSSTKVLGDGYYATHTFQEGLSAISEMAGGSESKLRELIPEVEGMNGVLGMTGINAETAASDLYQLNDALGATESAFDKMLSDSDIQLQLLQNNALKYFSDLGNGIMNSVGSIAEFLNEAFASGAIERFADAVIVLVSAFGIYKGAVIATTTVQKLQNIVLKEAVLQKKLAALAGHKLSTAQALAAAKTTLLSTAQFKLVAALKAVKVALLANPWTAAFVGITAVVTAITLFRDKTDEATEAMREATKEADAEEAKLMALEKVLKDSTKPYGDRKRALDELKSIMPSYNASLSQEGGLIDDNTDSLEKYIKQLKNSARAKVATDQMLKAEQERSSWYDAIGEGGQKTLIEGDINEYNSTHPMPGRDPKPYKDVDMLYYNKLKRIRAEFDAEVKKWSNQVDSYIAKSVEDSGNDDSEGGDTSSKRINPVTDEDKKLVEGSIGWYEAQISKFQALRKTFTDPSDIAAIDKNIQQMQVAIGILEDEANVENLDNEAMSMSSGYAEREKETYDERLANFKTFADRYKEIEDEHNSNLELVTAKGGTKADFDAEDQRYEEDLQSLNDEVLATIGEFESLGIEATDKVIDQMIADLQKAKTNLQNDTSGADNSTKIKAVNAEIERCIQLKKKNNSTSQGRTLKEWQEMEKQLNDCTSSFKEVGDAVGGVTGEIISSAGDITNSIISMTSGIIMLVENGVSGMTAAGKAGSTALKAVETASVILAVIGAVISLVTKLYNLIDGKKQDAIQAEIDAYNVLVETYDTLIDKQKELLENSKASMAFAEYNKALDFVTAKQKAAASSLSKWFESGAGLFSHSEGYKYNEEFGDDLSQSKLFSMSADEWEQFIVDHADVWGKLPQEVRNYAQEVMDADSEVANLGDTLQESLTGLSFDTLRDDFKDTLLDMSDDAADFSENLSGMLMNSIAEGLMDSKYDDMLKNWYKKYAEYMKDGKLDETELADLRNDWNEISAEADKDRENMKQTQEEIFDDDSDTPDERDPSAKGIATASQESVDENNGRLTAIQGHTYSLSESVKVSQVDVSAIRSTVDLIYGCMGAILSALIGIENNTSHLEDMKKDMHNVKMGIDSLNKGITLKR